MSVLVPFGKDAEHIHVASAIQELQACNATLSRHGLSLSPADAQAIVAGRLDALDEMERVEMGAGISRDLVLAFCGSPHVAQATFAATIVELQELFYLLKNESLEAIPDDELIETMRSVFDDDAEGDLATLAETLVAGLCRDAREASIAHAHAHLKGRRELDYEFVDQVYAPGWDGEGWGDE